MNQNVDLRFELSEASAVIADTSLIVRARFVEAADTMANMEVQNLRPAAVRSFWPDAPDDTVGKVSAGYAINGHRLRYRPTSAAISRAEEVMYGWLLQYVADDERRVLLGKWSMCLAAPHIAGSFRQFCQKTGRIRRTAERRLQNEFSSISSALLKSAQSLREPDWSRVSPMMPNSATDLGKVGTPVETSLRHWLPADAVPIHDPDSPDLAKLIRRLERANNRRQAA